MSTFVFSSSLATHSVSESVVVTDPEVILEKGTRSMLPCEVNPDIEVRIVFWYRGPQIQNAEILVKLSLPSGIKVGDGHRDGFYDIDSDFTLTITSVSVHDDTKFFCEIVTPTNEIFNNETDVTVFGKFMAW